ncbi:transferase hexapeptide repeat protein [Litoreibacter arenae DSM 19593]|uniref:Transferase hexapeptide repeat protein n=1 Tax=Litoreibacter arenae DSM 19593 TaxID=1123360 RepID=S9QC65_9RHOB|nr:transferase hexapeptide repeat protein [Litoreibacter arenae DSM 19593]
MRAIYAEFLGVPIIGKDENFFNAGGNSLLALKMQVSLQDRLEVPVTIVDIFRFPCPGQLAAHLSGGQQQPLAFL